ncbi:MAG TPA: EI24 domain-containing protein [Planctomycetota bacterium]|nr:EI24 domain-containing protein [Planctomycetota bacterium]
MIVLPCELCGYDAPSAVCPHCGGVSAHPSFAADRARGSEVRAGLAALPRGLGLLATTRGTKRWLVPPFVITTLAFGTLMFWAWHSVEGWVERAHEIASSVPELDAAWWERALQFVVGSWLFIVVAKIGALFLFVVIGFFAAMYTFSLFYEAISGPFLDEVQGRIEQRWFGVDPRNAIQRPTKLSVARCAGMTALASLAAGVLMLVAWRLGGGARWWLLFAALMLPFAALAAWKRDWGRWFAWALRVEASTLWTSVRTSLVALTFLILCLPLKFVPFVGPFLFAAAAGFATSISLLDIPFSRRGWSLAQRLRFVTGHAPALVAFGLVAGLVFLVPFVGPILMIPAASIGGLWLVVRLDKSRLRQQALARRPRETTR